MDAIERKKLRVVVAFTAVSALLGLLVGTLFVAMGEPAYWPPRLGAMIGAALGLGMGSSEEFIVPRTARRWSYGRLLSFRLLLYTSLIASLILVGNAVLNSVGLGVSIWRGVNMYVSEGVFARDMMFATGAAIVAVVGLQLSKLYRPREIGQLLTGKYHHPAEERRVVLFVDIVGSSGIVERLGPLAASRFLRDCFVDISEPILAWRGHVYQHLGDGIVVTWPGSSAKNVLRSIRCFFDMRNALAARAKHYLAEYQSVAEVRGGLHVGELVATWVGEAKRELALHGDVLHVAARLQSRCREIDATCVASEPCVRQVDLPKELEARDLGVLQLRGRDEAIRCYNVRVRPTARHAPPAT